jgi:hypothetical protein
MRPRKPTSSAWSRHKQKQARQDERHPPLILLSKKKGVTGPLLRFPLSYEPACLRRGVAVNKDVDAYTHSPGYYRPRLGHHQQPDAPPYSFQFFLSTFFHAVGDGCQLKRSGRDVQLCMLGTHEGVRTGGAPHLFRGLVALVRGLRPCGLSFGVRVGASTRTLSIVYCTAPAAHPSAVMHLSM